MKIETKSLSWFKPCANLRTELGTEAKLRRLGESLKKGQICPLCVRSSGDRRGWTIDSGHAGRRPA
jgi:hypothetical protein